MPIEKQYEKWARFENFLKFAEKKELKDRLKELDPPPMSNYVEPATLDNIMNKRQKHRPPSGRQKEAQGQSEHLERIAKMKELYGLFVKMEAKQLETPSQEISTVYKNESFLPCISPKFKKDQVTESPIVPSNKY